VKTSLKQCDYLQPVRNMNVHPVTQEWIIAMALLVNSVLKIHIQMGRVAANDVRLIPLQIMAIKFTVGQKCQR
jgi:hypothetical protein